MTPFMLGSVALAERKVTTRDLSGDARRVDGTIADLAFLAAAARNR